MARKHISQRLPRKVKRHPLLVQFIEYLIGGGVFFWTGYGSFALLYSGFNLNWLLAKMIADAVVGAPIMWCSVIGHLRTQGWLIWTLR